MATKIHLNGSKDDLKINNGVQIASKFRDTFRET